MMNVPVYLALLDCNHIWQATNNTCTICSGRGVSYSARKCQSSRNMQIISLAGLLSVSQGRKVAEGNQTSTRNSNNSCVVTAKIMKP